MIVDFVASLRPHHLTRHQKTIYSVGFLSLFFTLFDGLIAFILPIQIIGLGFSATQMGLIIGSSNIFGAIFDFALARFITNTNYRRLFLIFYGLCFIYPVLVWSSKTLPLFLLSMSVWGLYGDLNNFAIFDFVSRRTKSDEHSQGFGVLDVFRSIGYLISPIIAGLVVTESIRFFPFSISISFIIISFVFYLLLIDLSPKHDSPEYDHTPRYAKYNFFKEFKIIKSVGVTLFPVLLFNTLIHVLDGAIWAVGPVFGESFKNFEDFGGLLMTAYTLPGIFVGWYVGKITHRFGKKRTAFISFLLGCLFLMPISFLSNPYLVLLLAFVSSVFVSLAWPAIKGAYADYISESHTYSKEIESLHDFSCNIGYIIGPILGGLISDVFGMHNLFLILSAASVLVVCYLLAVTPKHIHVAVHRS